MDVRAVVLRLRRGSRGVLLPSLVAGLLVALAVGASAALFAANRPAGFEAEARLVALPRRGLDVPTTTAYYETLSRGQIIGTFAEVLQLERFTSAAADRLDLTPAERDGIGVDATVVPESAMILLTTTAADAGVAESMAGAIVEESAGFVGDLTEGYELQLVAPADGTATPTGLSGVQYAAVMTFVALAMGAAAQQVVQQVLQALDRRAELTAGQAATDQSGSHRPQPPPAAGEDSPRADPRPAHPRPSTPEAEVRGAR